MRSYTVQLGDKFLKVSGEQLDRFRGLCFVPPDLTARMSELVWLDMYVLDYEYGITPHEVLQAINELEGRQRDNGTKPPAPFRGGVLKGLWHKHYFAARFLAHNLLLGLGKNGLREIVEEVMDPAISPVVTEQMVAELARRVTEDNLESRDEAKKLTGEWVIYLPHRSGNYYLCCTTHQTADEEILGRILDHCVRDFPELPAWLEEARRSSGGD